MTQPTPIPGIVSINGTITPISEGRIPVLDHGFLFGDNIYETLRTFRQKPFLFSRHFERLKRSARAVFMDLPCSRQQLFDEALRTIEAAGHASEHRIRITITRGSGDVSPDPESCGTPSVIIFATPLSNLPGEVYDKAWK